jgi:hypothetical protein
VKLARTMVVLPLVLSCVATVVAQVQHPSSLVSWAGHGYDTEAYELPAVKIVAGWDATGLIRVDGRAFVHGSHMLANVPRHPQNLPAIDMDLSHTEGIILFQDGSIRTWGWDPQTHGAIPPALRDDVAVRKIASVAGCYAAIDSEHRLHIWGDPNVIQARGYAAFPPSPPGVKFLDIKGGGSHFLALRSDGQLVAWGRNSEGQCNVPLLPARLRYIEFAAGRFHNLARRSDGVIVSFGDNQHGQLQLPTLPSGVGVVEFAAGELHNVFYLSNNTLAISGSNFQGRMIPPSVPPGRAVVQVACGMRHSSALLSDGSVLSWSNTNRLYVRDVPIPPVGSRWTKLSLGAFHTAALTSDGGLVCFGDEERGQCDVPLLPAGLRYVDVGAFYLHTAAIRSDGQAFAWGVNPDGRCDIPPLPSGLRYEKVFGRDAATVLIRSDGHAVACGLNVSGTLNIPNPPPGVRYIQSALGSSVHLLLRSDGQIVTLTNTLGHLVSVPPLPPGRAYVQVAAYGAMGIPCLALRNDGQLMIWGSQLRHALAPLPFGVYYVEVAASSQAVMLLRSDGLIDLSTSEVPAIFPAPELLPGTSYVQVSSSMFWGARVGPTCTYIGFAPGCGSSQAPVELIPASTPRIGKTFEVNLINLPQNSAFMLFGLDRTAPQPLDQYGLPGCSLHLNPAASALLLGQHGVATYRLPIPNSPAFVGLRFYNQAIVPDVQAPNPLQASVSMASEGVIGHW